MAETRVTLAEYAAHVGRDRTRVFRKVKNGDFVTARLETIGDVSFYTIDKNEPYVDKRAKKAPRR